MKSAIIFIIIVAVLGVGLVMLSGKPSSNPEDGAAAVWPILASVLTSDTNAFDFGSISMAKGKVNYSFKINNVSSETLKLDKLYTSCMCTTASITLQGKKIGPFGMPGHGFVPPLNQTLGAGETAELEVVFDPAAHGPAGVGPIERVVRLETGKGFQEFNISAVVTP